MNLTKRFQNVIRAAKQKWGAPGTKKALWDREYAGGRWDHCENTPDAAVYRLVEKHSQHGSILDLGCGSGNTGNEINLDAYGTYTGVDISQVALDKATARSRTNGREHKNRYVQGDILGYEPDRRHDVILFRESLYYVPLSKIKHTLERYGEFLLPSGVFVVDVSRNGTHSWMSVLEILETNFAIVEKHCPDGASNYVVVFRMPTHASPNAKGVNA